MNEEIEAKVRIDDPQAFREHMAALEGAVEEKAVFEVNRLFDDPAETLRRQGAALRLRQDRPLSAGGRQRVRLTYKGPQGKGSLKRRTEHEVDVGDAETMVDIFGAIGLAETFYYEKRRTSWTVGKCEVVLDEVPRLGWFVEVEGPTEKIIRKCLTQLGLGSDETITRSYVELLAEDLEAAGDKSRRAAFEEA